jgi:hypothetical protein
MVAQQEPGKIAEEALQKFPGEMGEVRRNQSRLWRILDRKIDGALLCTGIVVILLLRVVLGIVFGTKEARVQIHLPLYQRDKHDTFGDFVRLVCSL